MTFAVRSGQAGDVTYTAEQPIGLLEGDLVVSGETPEAVAQSLVQRIAPEGEMIVTLYYGAGHHRGAGGVRSGGHQRRLPG